jgi:hypothetical protein
MVRVDAALLNSRTASPAHTKALGADEDFSPTLTGRVVDLVQTAKVLDESGVNEADGAVIDDEADRPPGRSIGGERSSERDQALADWRRLSLGAVGGAPGREGSV